MHEQDSFSSVLEELRPLLLRVSLLAARMQSRDEFSVWHKKGQGPCTSADLSVDQVLEEALHTLVPEAGWLSEESRSKQGRRHSLLWVVDPIDGTRDFIAGSPEYSISAALIQDKLPILGGVALPAQQTLVLGQAGKTLLHWQYRLGEQNSLAAHTDHYANYYSHAQFQSRILPQVLWQKQAIKQKDAPRLSDAKVLVSRTEWKKGLFASMQNKMQLIPSSSIARKLALLAIGEGDMVLSFYPKHLWDIAGGLALLACRQNYRFIDLKHLQEYSLRDLEAKSHGLAVGEKHLLDEFLRTYNT